MPDLPGFTRLKEILGPGIYALSYKGEIVYIGKSNHILRRVYEHRSAYYLSKQRRARTYPPKKVMLFDDFSIKACRVEDLDKLERELIAKYRPKYNDLLRSKITKPIELVIQGVALCFNESKPAATTISRRL